MSRTGSTVSTALETWKGRWHALASREKAGLAAALVVVGVAMLWWLGVAPALRTVRQAPATRQQLDVQIQQMQSLQAQAAALQALPRVSGEGAARALESAVRQRLGSGGQLTLAGERATVTLRSVSADALAQWLAEVRVNARAVPVEARLTRAAGTGPAAWSGTLVLSLPAAGERP